MEHYFTNNTNLRSEIRSITYENKGRVFTFFSDLGVFSKDRIDFGSKTLLETIIKDEERRNLQILDVGCGYGFLGIVLGALLDSEITLVDVNKRAVHLTERNIKENKIRGTCMLSDGYANITDTYDMIVTNPPIRAGKNVVLKILLEAKEHLKKDGVLWFVIRKDQGAKSILKCLEKEYNCEIRKKEKGFYIIIAKMH